MKEEETKHFWVDENEILWFKDRLVVPKDHELVDIWECNKEWIRKRTDNGEDFTREVIQSIVFIFLPLGERVHLTNPVYYY